MAKTGKARAHTNIALIKYWGKADEDLIIPMNNSISLTLDRFYTETKATFDEQFETDQFYLNGEKADEKETKKVSAYLDIVRKLANTNMKAHIESENFVPTAAGLASSASAFAALAAACNAALDLNLSDKDLSRLARRGSGSASRSIFGGFAEWEKGHDDESSYAHALESDGFEDDLAMIFVVINQASKKVKSRAGMSLTKNTSRFYQYWLDHVDADIKEAKAAIADKDFDRLGEVFEANGLRMHATNLGAEPPFTYLVSDSYEAMALVHELREAGISAYFTMDAGPNVKVLVQKKDQAAVIDKLTSYFNPDQIIASDIGTGVEILSEEDER